MDPVSCDVRQHDALTEESLISDPNSPGWLLYPEPLSHLATFDEAATALCNSSIPVLVELVAWISITCVLYFGNSIYPS